MTADRWQMSSFGAFKSFRPCVWPDHRRCSLPHQHSSDSHSSPCSSFVLPVSKPFSSFSSLVLGPSLSLLNQRCFLRGPVPMLLAHFSCPLSSFANCFFRWFVSHSFAIFCNYDTSLSKTSQATWCTRIWITLTSSCAQIFLRSARHWCVSIMQRVRRVSIRICWRNWKRVSSSLKLRLYLESNSSSFVILRIEDHQVRPVSNRRLRRATPQLANQIVSPYSSSLHSLRPS